MIRINFHAQGHIEISASLKNRLQKQVLHHLGALFAKEGDVVITLSLRKESKMFKAKAFISQGAPAYNNAFGIAEGNNMRIALHAAIQKLHKTVQSKKIDNKNMRRHIVNKHAQLVAKNDNMLAASYYDDMDEIFSDDASILDHIKDNMPLDDLSESWSSSADLSNDLGVDAGLPIMAYGYDETSERARRQADALLVSDIAVNANDNAEQIGFVTADGKTVISDEIVLKDKGHSSRADSYALEKDQVMKIGLDDAGMQQDIVVQSQDLNRSPLLVKEYCNNPMRISIEEAISKFAHKGANMSGHPLIFVNTNNNKLSMLFQRKDGNITWFEPGSEASYHY